MGYKKLNIFNQEGYLTDKQRKEPLEHICNHFIFKSNMDLSEKIKVIPIGWTEGEEFKLVWLERYTTDIAIFISWWTIHVWRDLNGFPGLSCIKFEEFFDIK